VPVYREFHEHMLDFATTGTAHLSIRALKFTREQWAYRFALGEDPDAWLLFFPHDREMYWEMWICPLCGARVDGHDVYGAMQRHSETH
jgi:hypothetical protein